MPRHAVLSISLPAGLVVAALAAGCSLMLDAEDIRGNEADAGAGEEAPDDAGGTVADAAPAPDAPADAAPAPVDVAGAYSVSITSRANECGFAGWQEGAVTTGVPLTITQEEDAVTAAVEGPAGLFLDAALGSRMFQGEADGPALSLTLFGTNSFTSAGCTYTVRGVVSANLDGDVILGEIEYEPATNGSPDCGPLETCSSVQEFNGTRPPS
jgi:hypothetical protein